VPGGGKRSRGKWPVCSQSANEPHLKERKTPVKKRPSLLAGQTECPRVNGINAHQLCKGVSSGIEKSVTKDHLQGKMAKKAGTQQNVPKNQAKNTREKRQLRQEGVKQLGTTGQIVIRERGKRGNIAPSPRKEQTEDQKRGA